MNGEGTGLHDMNGDSAVSDGCSAERAKLLEGSSTTMPGWSRTSQPIGDGKRRRVMPPSGPLGRSAQSADLAAPYTGQLVCRSWNAQAFFAIYVGRRRRKKAHCLRLMKWASSLAMQETHGTDGRQKALSLPSSVQAYQSAGTTTVGGVGLWVDRAFLQKFRHVGNDDVI
jgi:hypothetical protein